MVCKKGVFEMKNNDVKYEGNTWYRMNPRIVDALVKMDFIRRYEELSRRFSVDKMPAVNQLERIDRKKVLELIEKLGYSAKYYGKEKFFQIEEQIDNLTFAVHICFHRGRVELIWVVRENGELLLGRPWFEFSRQLIDIDYIIKSAYAGTYETLEEILKITFEMYEDFKQIILND